MALFHGQRSVRTVALAFAGTLALAGCAAPTPPVEVTRFLAEQPGAALAQGSIAVEAAPGTDPDSLELRSYRAAVGRELARLGYREVAAGQGLQVAEVRLERSAFRPDRDGGPVSVGMGGATGSYGSGVGLGIGLNLSGRPKKQVATDLAVVIRDRASGRRLWEGRAQMIARAGTPNAETQLAAPRMAEALFAGFPGESGETILVK